MSGDCPLTYCSLLTYGSDTAPSRPYAFAPSPPDPLSPKRGEGETRLDLI